MRVQGYGLGYVAGHTSRRKLGFADNAPDAEADEEIHEFHTAKARDRMFATHGRSVAQENRFHGVEQHMVVDEAASHTTPLG